MTLFLAWLLNGGWKYLLGGIAAAGIAILAGLWLHHYHSLEGDAAKVPGLVATIAGRDALIGEMKHADADRDKADKDLSTWQGASAAAFNALRAGMKHAPIATNPVCLPSASDRLQRNSALNKLLPAPAVPAQ